MPDLVPHDGEWVSRCDLCGKPFLYRPKHGTSGSLLTVINSDDEGEKRGNRWGHARCFESEHHE